MGEINAGSLPLGRKGQHFENREIRYHLDSMDPLSVLGAAGSLVALVEISGKLGKGLFRLARGVKAAETNILRFARKVSMFSTTSNVARTCLLDHYSRSGTELRTFANIEKTQFMKDAGASAEDILNDVKRIAPRMWSMRSSGVEFSLVSKIKWHQRKSEVHDLKLEMTAFETTLTLLMTTVVYEVQLQQNADPMTL